MQTVAMGCRGGFLDRSAQEVVQDSIYDCSAAFAASQNADAPEVAHRLPGLGSQLLRGPTGALIRATRRGYRFGIAIISLSWLRLPSGGCRGSQTTGGTASGNVGQLTGQCEGKRPESPERSWLSLQKNLFDLLPKGLASVLD